MQPILQMATQNKNKMIKKKFLKIKKPEPFPSPSVGPLSWT